MILQRLGPLLQGIAAVAIVRNNLNLLAVTLVGLVKVLLGQVGVIAQLGSGVTVDADGLGLGRLAVVDHLVQGIGRVGHGGEVHELIGAGIGNGEYGRDHALTVQAPIQGVTQVDILQRLTGGRLAVEIDAHVVLLIPVAGVVGVLVIGGLVGYHAVHLAVLEQLDLGIGIGGGDIGQPVGGVEILQRSAVIGALADLIGLAGDQGGNLIGAGTHEGIQAGAVGALGAVLADAGLVHLGMDHAVGGEAEVKLELVPVGGLIVGQEVNLQCGVIYGLVAHLGPGLVGVVLAGQILLAAHQVGGVHVAVEQQGVVQQPHALLKGVGGDGGTVSEGVASLHIDPDEGDVVGIGIVGVAVGQLVDIDAGLLLLVVHHGIQYGTELILGIEKHFLGMWSKNVYNAAERAKSAIISSKSSNTLHRTLNFTPSLHQMKKTSDVVFKFLTNRKK